GSGAGRTAEPRASVWEGGFAQAAAFRGGVQGGSGLSGPAPGAGEAVINDDLATQLGAQAGDRLTVYLYGRPTAVRVARVVATVGLAGAGTGQTAARNAFFAPGTLVQAAREDRAAPPTPLLRPPPPGPGAQRARGGPPARGRPRPGGRGWGRPGPRRCGPTRRA